MRPYFNKHQIKAKYLQYKQQFKYWGYQSKEIAKQVFIPLAIFQLVRTIIFPTAFDVLLLVVIFIIFCALLIDWV